MKQGTRVGFTLIELLITIAILAIASGALIAVVVAPIKEQVITDIRTEQLEGTSLFFTTLIEDAHRATNLEADNDESNIRFSGPEETIVYQVDDGGVLRRNVIKNDEGDDAPDPGLSKDGSPLVAMVSDFSTERIENSRRWRFTITTSKDRLHQDHRLTRSVDLLVGQHSTTVEENP